MHFKISVILNTLCNVENWFSYLNIFIIISFPFTVIFVTVLLFYHQALEKWNIILSGTIRIHIFIYLKVLKEGLE